MVRIPQVPRFFLFFASLIIHNTYIYVIRAQRVNCKCRVMKMKNDDEIAQCTKCNIVQFMAETKYLLAANFTMKTTSEEKMHVQAYGNSLLDICETKDCTDITVTYS